MARPIILHRDNPDKEPLVGHVKVTREDWLNVARDILVSDGVAEVKVLAISERLGVSRSSFYWYFKSRKDLLQALLDDWEERNTAIILQQCGLETETVTASVCNFFRCFLDPGLFDQGLDFAIREWSRRDGQVRKRIDDADTARIAAVTEMFARFGNPPDDADTRARILYFMQLGYHALDQTEPMDVRLSRTSGYLRAFTGVEPRAEEIEALRADVARSLELGAMNRPFSDTRKIDPTRGTHTGDNTPNDQNRVEIGPTQLAYREWAARGLALPDLQQMRRDRWQRLTEHIVARGYGGLLMFDPLNIRYATDSTNMQLWNIHNPFRAVLLLADGYMVIWDYKNAPFLSEFNPLVREQRSGADLFYFTRGDKISLWADAFANEVRLLLAEHAGGNRRLAVDKIMPHGLRALDAQGLVLEEGEEVTEKSRSVKSPDEILAMRCAMLAGENAIAEMERVAREEVPRGTMSEDDIWAVLHAENIRRGGEWIETRLLTSGPRTNPWFQECGGRIVQNNEIVAFDTDLIGAYGICVDISRTWWIGDREPRRDMVYAMQHAHDHIMTNMEMLAPGVSMRDLSLKAHKLNPEYDRQKYSCLMHGVGLCDEWPLIAYPDRFVDGAFDYVLEPGMVFCVEALVSPEGGDFSIKLEEQVLITEDGYENLTRYPFDPRLMGES